MNNIFGKDINEFSKELILNTPKSWLNYQDVKENLEFLEFNIIEKKMYNYVLSNLFYSKDGNVKRITISSDFKDTDIATKHLIMQYCTYLYNYEEGLGLVSFDSICKKGNFKSNVKRLCGTIQHYSVDKEFPLFREGNINEKSK